MALNPMFVAGVMVTLGIIFSFFQPETGLWLMGVGVGISVGAVIEQQVRR